MQSHVEGKKHQSKLGLNKETNQVEVKNSKDVSDSFQQTRAKTILYDEVIR